MSRGRGRVPGRSLLALLLVLLMVPLVGSTASAIGPSATPAARADGEVRPLVIVLDTSGSMSEEDEDGTIKLAGAQAALTRMLREQRPGALVGLWAYPDDGACGAGRSVITTSPLDQTRMIDEIRELEAGGETPTGNALRAAVEEQKRLGYSGATILLISDGLSTCDPDPCVVAQEIVDEGFDITVRAAGFQISSEGLDELSCIADATHGSVHEARNAEELDAVVEEATDGRLTVEVTGMPRTIPAGSAARVTVRVTNETHRDVDDVQVAFSFANADTGGRAIVPSVLPPRKPLGNLRAGETVTWSWLVSFGSRGKTGQAGYKLTAWGSNSQPTTSAGSVDVVAPAADLESAGELLRRLEGERIAILGDSFSSGEGAGTYQEGTAEFLGSGAADCHKSESTYLFPLFDPDDVELIACSGATTRYLKKKTNSVQEEQVRILREQQDRDGPVAAAFMTIGGNDIDFAGIVKRCVHNFSATRRLLPPLWEPWEVVADQLAGLGLSFVSLDPRSRCADDEQWVEEVNARPDSEDFTRDLAATYRMVYAAINDPDVVEERDGEVAPLYVLAYPQMFAEPQWMSRCPFFDPAELDFANDLVERLNNALQRAVRRVRADGYRIHLVRSTQEAFLPDNTACSRPGSDGHVNSLDFSVNGRQKLDSFVRYLGFQEFMHPNAAGYAAETTAILAWSTSAVEEEPDGGWHIPDAGRASQVKTWLAKALTPTLPAAGPAVFDAAANAWSTSPLDARAGQPVEVEVVGAAPGSRVTLSVASSTRMVGVVDVDESGAGRSTFALPALLAPGEHRLTAVGFAADGTPALAAQRIDVARYLPAWLTPLTVLVLLAAVLSVVLHLRARRQRRT